MRVVITGGTGLIGRRLVSSLRDHEVTVLSRDPVAARLAVDATRYVAWDGISAISPSVFEGADVVYHLAGEPVAEGRWTAAKKRRILDSRRFGTRTVVDAIAAAGSEPTLVSASAVGFYGSRGNEVLTEESRAGTGFLPTVCEDWEDDAARAIQFGCRVAMMRIGIVLAREGGALAKMLPLFRTGLGGRLASGDQWMPWIHIEDVVGLLRFAAATRTLSGPVNTVAPKAVTNAELTAELASALGRPTFLPAPSLALRLVLGELSDVVLSSQHVVPEAALRHGYEFRFPELAGALEDLVGRAKSAPQEQAA